MHTISYTAARNQLATTMDQVCNDHAPVIITRNNSQSVVMLSIEDYESIEETMYLLSSRANAERLFSAMEEIESMIAANNKPLLKSKKTTKKSTRKAKAKEE